MSDLILYLIKSNIALAFFFLGYHLLLRKLTFYGINRYYLIFALLFSALYPFIPVDIWSVPREEMAAPLLLTLSDWQQLQLPKETNSVSNNFSQVYWISIGLFSLLFLIKLMGIGRIHLRSMPAKWDRFIYRKSNENISPFSFLTHIYFNPRLYAEDEYEKIFSHEQVHVRQLHSLDILLGEISLVFFWYNPFCWLIRKAIQDNIEFMTDRRVLSMGLDKKNYQYSLLQIANLSHPSYLGNHFNFKNLKQRIIMMNKKQSSNIQLGKYVFIIPAIVLGSLNFGVSKAYEKEDIQEKSQPTTPVQEKEETINEFFHKESHQTVMINDTLPAEVPPLLMVDGSLHPYGSLNKLDQDKIESIELKDAAELSIYGSRAENGIIQITTKPNMAEADPSPEHQDTINTKDPLYVVDGVRQKAPDLHPDNIESVSVIKDKAAISLYGEEGIHGVIEVTTRQGRKDTNTDATSGKITPNPVEGTGSIKKIYNSTTLQGNLNENVLLIVDGTKMSYSNLNQLDPKDIQSLTVYKGENAISRYGEEGKDGVIEIVTKSKN